MVRFEQRGHLGRLGGGERTIQLVIDGRVLAEIQTDNLDPQTLANLTNDYYIYVDDVLIRLSKLYLIGIGVYLINALLNSLLGIYR